MEWIGQEIERLCQRHDTVYHQNDLLGDEIEELESQLEVAQSALQQNPDYQAVRPGLQPQTKPPQGPAEIADLLRTAYLALQTSQLPGVTQVSSDALSAVLAEVSAAQKSLTPLEPQTDKSAEASSSAAPSDQPKRPRWGDQTDDPEDLGDDDFDLSGQGEEMDDIGSDGAEPFVEGAGCPPYSSEDPAKYEQGDLYLSKKCKQGLRAVGKSHILKKAQIRSEVTHRGPGAFAALRAAQKAAHAKGDG
jgi:hypothetical protein